MKPLSKAQIEFIISWMNEWEYVKNSSIPARFKEDFELHQQLHTMFNKFPYRPMTSWQTIKLLFGIKPNGWDDYISTMQKIYGYK